MRSQQSTSTASSAQDIGGAEVQLERVRTGIVQTADGSRVLVGVVATSQRSGVTAARVVEQIFQTVSGSPASDLPTALKRGMEIASQSLAHQADQVAAVAVAIRRNRVHFANAGNNAAVRVAGSEVIRLTESNASWLGSADVPRLQTSPEAGLELQRGDRVVLLSAGILKAITASGAPFVNLGEIPENIKNLSPEDAAKHLVSLALGRDIEGNATVAVLGEAKEARNWAPLLLIGAGAIAVLLLAIGAFVLTGPPSRKTPTEYGFAVLVRGGVLVASGDGSPNLAGNLDTIPAGSALSAQTDAALGLQSTHEESAELTRGSIYLDQAAEVRLSEIDPRIDAGGPGKTLLALDQGSMLVYRQSGTWEYQVLAITERASLIGAGAGALGVGTSGGSVQIDCLFGVCRYESPQGDVLLLDAGDRVLVGASSGIATQSPIPPDARSSWTELCGGCLP